MNQIMPRCMTKLLNYFKSINCSFAMHNNNNDDNNNNKMGIRKKWTSVNLGPIIIQLMHSFEVNIRICQPENSDVHRGKAEVNITFEG